MWVIFDMTGSAILRGVLKISKRMGIGMTIFTGSASMLAGQFEGELIMCKLFAEPVSAFVTIDA